MALVRAAKEAAHETQLFYGGGIHNADTARLAAEHADTIVVGNIIYTDLTAALSTVEAVRAVIR